MSLDRAAEILSWGPTADLDPIRLSIEMQVWRVVFMIGVKAMRVRPVTFLSVIYNAASYLLDS